MRVGSIYKITNLIDNKIYIGLTSRTEPIRWEEHLRDARNINNNTLLAVSIRESGQENFRREILEDNIPLDSLEGKEQYWIAKYQSNDRTIGLNMTTGGQKPPKEKGVSVYAVNRLTGDIEHKFNSMREAAEFIGSHHSNIGKACREKHRVVASYMWRYTWDYSRDEIMFLIDTYSISTKANSKMVEAYDFETKEVLGKFKSAEQAKKEWGIDPSDIRKTCRGIKTSAGKTSNGNKIGWRYAE